MAETKQHRRPEQHISRISATAVRGPDAPRHAKAEAGAPLTVGTASDNDLVLSDPTVSQYHLELACGPSGIVVSDLESTNGTLVGTTSLKSGVVAPGTQLRIGDTTLVVSTATEAQLETPELSDSAGFVFVSTKMLEVVRSIRRLASFGGSVLVQGETGTGKELVARALHREGPRKERPLVVVDCGALPHNLVESELFGHERGAFTGATQRSIGAFERAHGGTIFLDEIGELPPQIQPVLLGVLERRQFRRVGGDRDVQIDVRVISATHRDLRAEVNRNTFRADLYFRLAGARIFVPPLRERPEDVAPLVRAFALEVSGAPESPFTSEVETLLAGQHWTGNVRELRNLVERAIAEGTGGDQSVLDTPHHGDGSPPPETTQTPLLRYRDARAKVIADFERTYVTALMESVQGNASEAARRAQMDRPYLLSLLKKIGLR